MEDYYYDESRPVKQRICDNPGCMATGDYRAPKSRDHMNDYYWFCLDHVREYNRNWDYFAGLPEGAIEDYIRNAAVWERPSWPMGEWRVREQKLRDQVMRDFFGGERHAAPAADAESGARGAPGARVHRPRPSP